MKYFLTKTTRIDIPSENYTVHGSNNYLCSQDYFSFIPFIYYYTYYIFYYFIILSADEKKKIIKTPSLADWFRA